MSKFWISAGAIVAIGLIAIIGTVTAQEVFFTDLETECRFDRDESVDVTVSDDNELQFNGYFPVQSTSADVRYDYDRSGDRIVLNVYADNDQEPESFRDTCYASGVYEASSIEYEGRYTVVVQHNGEEVDRRVINFR